MRQRLAAAQLAAARREFARGVYYEHEVSASAIATHLGVSRATVYRYLGIRDDRPPKPRLSRAHLVEAGLAYYARSGLIPTSVDWNATLVSASKERLVLWAQGWAPRSHPRPQRRWPDQREVARDFPGGWRHFRKTLLEELARREAAHEPYQPVPVPLGHELRAELFSPSLVHRRDHAPFDARFWEAMAEGEAEMARAARRKKTRNKRAATRGWGLRAARHLKRLRSPPQ